MDPRELLKSPVFPLSAGGVPRQPTADEKAELIQLRDMQVRRDAVNFASVVFEGTGLNGAEVLDLAAAIANFITEG
jgi:hypothetical protein